MPVLFCDLETYSPVPISAGAYRYAEQAEVLLWAYAFDDGPVQCWDVTASPAVPTALLVALNQPDTTTVWHNGGNFDRVVLERVAPELAPPLDRIHDTMVQALAHGLPGSLDTLGEILKLDQDKRKHKRGRELIQLFCKPRPANSKLRRYTRDTHPAEWAEFVEYAKADILAMREVYARLPRWNYPDNRAEFALWQLDQRINDRGVAVDLGLANAAIRATDRARDTLKWRTQELTGGAVEAATQRDKLLGYLLAEHGVGLPDMTAATIERRIEDASLPIELRELLAVRLDASRTSASKYKRLVEATGTDGRLRGVLQFCGASRTGRWAGRLFQPQNLPRPTHKQPVIEQGIAAMKANTEDLVFGDEVMALASSAVRGALIAPPGRKLVVADLANIEGRGIAWLAGEAWKLDAFRAYDAGTGPDLYKLAYSKAFGTTPDAVTKDQRQVGKVMELMLGYEGGVGAFLTGAATYGIDLDAMAEAALPGVPADVLAEAQDFLAWRKRSKAGTFGLSDRAFVACESLKRLWRMAHPEIATWWGELQEAARRAILSPGVAVPARKVKMRRDGAWLRVALPSGRVLCYSFPSVDDRGALSYMGLNQYSRKWQRLQTYGGKLAENITQAVARDIIAANMFAIEAEGYEIVLTVHDEDITEAPDTPEYNAEHLARLMAKAPAWADDLPLAAAGFEAYRYRKD